MQVSILKGAYFDRLGNIRASLPMNMWPVVNDTGFSKGYLRTAPGLTMTTVGPGQDRGSFVWEGIQYRVMGTELVSVAGGVVTGLGAVGSDGLAASMDFGAGLLAVCSSNGLFYWNPTTSTFTIVTDPHLGKPIDVCFVDGYFMLTDGTDLYVTDLTDPTLINPAQFEAPGEDPSPPVAVRRIRDEIYAVTTNTIQNFQNVGGLDFPFQVNPAGMIPKGATGTRAVCYFLDTLAFVGGGRNEAPSVYLAGYGQALPISTPEVDRIIAALSPAQQAAIEIEGLTEEAEQRLLVHLPTVSLVYHRQASLAAEQPVWTQMAGGVAMNAAYPARHFACIGSSFYGGSPSGQIGLLDESEEKQFGAATTCQFDTVFLYNGGLGAILKSAELMGTPGLAPPDVTANALLSWTKDGQTWSAQQSVSMGASGAFLQRMQWRPKTRMRTVLGLRFQLPASAVAAFGALEVNVEPLNA